MNIGYLKLNW